MSFASRLSSNAFCSYPIGWVLCFSRYCPEFGRPASGLVGSSGLEPPTSRLSGARSNHLSYEPIQFPSVYLVSLTLILAFTFSVFGCGNLPLGGDDGVRTHDPLLAGQVLSQLSYTPIEFSLMRFL